MKFPKIYLKMLAVVALALFTAISPVTVIAKNRDVTVVNGQEAAAGNAATAEEEIIEPERDTSLLAEQMDTSKETDTMESPVVSTDTKEYTIGAVTDVEYRISYKLPVMDKKDFIPCKSLIIKDNLPEQVTFVSGKFTHEDGSDVDVLDGSIYYDASLNEVRFEFSEEFLAKRGSYNGETYTLKITAYINAETEESEEIYGDVKNFAQAVIDGRIYTSNTVTIQAVPGDESLEGGDIAGNAEGKDGDSVNANGDNGSIESTAAEEATKTGDESSVLLWLALMVAAWVSIVLILRADTSQKRNSE